MKRVFFVSVALVACEVHEENIPLIHVDPHAAIFAGMVRGGGTPDNATASVSRVHTMRAGEELQGPSATGHAGAFILDNDEVSFVIDSIGGDTGGNLVDAADAHVRTDELGQVAAYFGAPERRAVYVSATPGVLQDGTAFVEVRGHEHDEPRLIVRTRYTLHGGDRAMLMETTLENTSDHVIVLPGLGDAIQWGGADVFAPDRGRAFKGASNGAFLGGVGHFASYAFTSTDGAIEADSSGSSSTTLQQHRTEIEPKKAASYRRVFLVGPRADVSGLVAELTKSAGGAVGVLKVTLLAETGAVPGSPDATVEIGDAGGRALMDLRADGSGALVGEVPPGKYTVKYLRGGGRMARGVSPVVEVFGGQETSTSVEVTTP